MLQELNLENVRAALHARLSGRGIDVEKVYINAVESEGKSLVTYSQTLVWAFLLMLQDVQVPKFGGAHMGVFSEAYTFDPKYRFEGLDFEKVNQLGEQVAKNFLA